jgi:hypothetical protein
MSRDNDWLRQIQVCRDINQKINDFGVTDYQRMKLIELLSLELESRDAMLSVLEVIKPHIISKEELIAPEGEKASGEFDSGPLD